VLSAEVGPGDVFEKPDSSERSYATLRAGEKFTQKLSSHARFWQPTEFLPQVDDFDTVRNDVAGVVAPEFRRTFPVLLPGRRLPESPVLLLAVGHGPDRLTGKR
jgi:hypothetical protein